MIINSWSEGCHCFVFVSVYLLGLGEAEFAVTQVIGCC